jgi:hypothetical protein
LTEDVIVGYGNLYIFGGLPEPGFRHGKDIRVSRVEASDVDMHETKAFSITEVNK